MSANYRPPPARRNISPEPDHRRPASRTHKRTVHIRGRLERVPEPRRAWRSLESKLAFQLRHGDRLQIPGFIASDTLNENIPVATGDRQGVLAQPVKPKLFCKLELLTRRQLLEFRKISQFHRSKAGALRSG